MPHLLPAFSSAILRRHFSSKPKLPSLCNVPSKHRHRAFEQAQSVIVDYLHATRTLPFTYADQIVKNSQFSVSQIVSKVKYSAPTFPGTIRKFLRYHPINEFEFFFESIGIDYGEVTNGFSKPNVFFISEDPGVFDVACLLCGFGFPWNKLGLLYRKEVSIFSNSSAFLHSRLHGLKARGFGTFAVVGICLSFPSLLSAEDALGGQLVDDLKRVFIDFGLGGSIESNVDSWYEVSRKIRVFYELDIGKGNAGELMGKCKNIFIDYTENVLAEKVGFFCRLGAPKADVGFLLLERPELLSIDLETPKISVLNLLKQFGAPEEVLKWVEQKYPYVLGRNKMAHLPHALRAMNLHEWFFEKIEHGNHHLLLDHALSSAEEGIDDEYAKCLEKIRCLKLHAYKMEKLNFLHSIGFAENSYCVRILTQAHGSSKELQQRFDCLLAVGIEFSKLCKMLSVSPKLLNQDKQVLVQKVNFLCQEVGLPVEYLDAFPSYLCFNLEKRIKPRYKLHLWLQEQGLCTRKYSLGSIIATSEKNFIARLSLIHPTAPKLWYERFASKTRPMCSALQMKLPCVMNVTQESTMPTSLPPNTSASPSSNPPLHMFLFVTSARRRKLCCFVNKIEQFYV